MSLTLSSENHDVCTEISLDGSALTDYDFVELIDKVEASIENEQPNLILNLKEISILNSLGINTLIKVFTKCRNNGGDLYIVNISDKINQVLLLTKLNTVLNIADSVEEAINNFKK